MAGGGANNKAWSDGTNSALMASGTRSLLGSPATVVSALKVGNPNVFVANDNGSAAMASDYVELHKNRTLISRFDNAGDGNIVQCDEIGGIGRGYDVHRRARLWRRRGDGARCGGRVARLWLPGPGDCLPQGLERLRGRAAPCPI
jgi:Glucodextranase, domain N